MASRAMRAQAERIMKHLKSGGATDDEAGRLHITQYCMLAMADGEIGSMCRRYAFDATDLYVMFAGMMDELMPNPCIKCVVGEMLAAELPFVETFRLENMMSTLADVTAGMTPDDRRKEILRFSMNLARVTWTSHTKARGEATYMNSNEAGKSGCAVVLFLASSAIVLGILLGKGVLQYWL